MIAEAGMRAMPVVLMQPVREVPGTLARRLVGAGIGPFAQRRLDEALGLAVGSWCVGFGAHVLDTQSSAQPAEAPRLVAGAVVGEHAGEADAQTGVIAQGLEQRGAGALRGLIRINGAEGDPGVIVDGDVNILPAGTRRILCAIPCHPMAGATETAELFNIQVQQPTRLVVLVALYRRGRFKP